MDEEGHGTALLMVDGLRAEWGQEAPQIKQILSTDSYDNMILGQRHAADTPTKEHTPLHVSTLCRAIHDLLHIKLSCYLSGYLYLCY